MSRLEAIKYQRGSLQLLDQRLLPLESVYLPVPDPQTAWAHIKDMVVRGAPAIAVAGALALAVDLAANKRGGGSFDSVEAAVKYINSTMTYLVTSRPTAVNLADFAAKVESVTARAASAPGATPLSVTEAVISACEATLPEDVAANRTMGALGADALLQATAAHPARAGGKINVLTHCNTGSLATAGFGTALGVIRALYEQNKLGMAYCTETRPYNQGARLTAFELVHDGLPATLICDSAAAYLMASGEVDAIVVGADRITANGDTANKIGTYNLAVAAKHHNVPFFIAAPTTTVDLALDHGSQITIEQRTSEEVTHFKGSRVVVDGIKVWNPSFDVTPATLIHAIITDKGVAPKVSDEFSLRDFLGAGTPPIRLQSV